ncbi:MAG: hypothetical protein ACIAXF_06030 [Phycisphaerales bacterium JB063]
MQRPLDRQRIVNLASGYCFACWVSTTLAWVLFVANAWWAVLLGTMAIVAGLLGLPRGMQTLRGKFIWVPLLTLVYIVLALVIMATVPTDPVVLVSLCGVVYSSVAGMLVWSIARHDFAKPVPAWMCATCGYTLFGLRDGVCPECGEVFDPERVPEMAPQAGDARP